MCGLFSFVGVPPERSHLTKAVDCLRHRGSSGFGYWWRDDSGQVETYKASEPSKQNPLPAVDSSGSGCFIAHWRYATTGSNDISAIQPIVGKASNPVLAHNGQFLLPEDEECSDTEIAFQNIEGQLGELRDAASISRLLRGLDGAFSLLCIINGQLIVARDVHGFRPLFVAEYAEGLAISSETTALEFIGSRNIREFPPGHWAIVRADGISSYEPIGHGKIGLCAFEHVYFHSRRGKLGGLPVSFWRKRLGKSLAEEKPVEADVIVPVPHSGIDAGEGYAAELHIPCIPAVRRTPEAERTFIATSASRDQKLAAKFQIDSSLIVGKRVCLVDDSVVRGATLNFLSREMREAGASAVHARIAAPKFRFPCFFGIDVPSRGDLPVNKFAISEVAEKLGVDSLEFLSVSGLHEALKFSSVCTGCFTSRYPISAQRIRLMTEKEETVAA